MHHKLVRVTLAQEESDFSFDLVVDEQNKPIRKLAMLGWWGKLRSNDLLPFILRNDGKMDFGALPGDPDYYSSERYGVTDILEREIIQGRRVDVSVDGEDYQLSITQVTELVGIGPSAAFPA